MASSCQFERLLPLLALVAVGVFRNRKIVGDFIKEHTSPKDYFARLPDDILCHIISYLERKDAVRTSVLSRRWRKLYYTLLPNPRFEFHKMVQFVPLTNDNSCDCDSGQRFVAAIDTFLGLRSGFPMESFTLRFGMITEFPGYLRKWVNCIVSSGVRKLDINFSPNDDEVFMLPDKLILFPFKVLLSAYMLEYVQLSFCILEPNFQGLSNSLKELSLSFVPFVNGELESILSSCPHLTLLKLEDCKLPCKLLVNSLGLRTLKIRFCEQETEIGFSAPNLDVFEYYGNRAVSFSPSDVPNMSGLFLDFSCHYQPPHGFGGFVLGATCLDVLWIQAFSHQVQSIRKEMPTLWNLHTLSLHVIEYFLDLRDIISMIGVCPNLSKFELSTPLCSLSYTERDAEVLPMFANLKMVMLDGFKFEAAQKKFALQLIRCAPALEQMTIYIAYRMYSIGKQVEEILPWEKRVFPELLINRTKQQLEQHASSPLLVLFK